MSIIANALLKQNQQSQEKKPNGENSVIWKVLLLAALLVIIILLSVLIWTLNKPTMIVSSPVVVTKEEVVVPSTASVVSSQPSPVVTPPTPNMLENKIVSTPPKPIGKPITRVTFETKPLPLINLNKMNKALKKQQSVVIPEETVGQESTNELVGGSEDPVEDVTIQPIEDITDSEVSEELKAYFQEALTNSQVDERDKGTEEGDDLNIFKMDPSFQHLVPTIRYAFHVYSSNQSDRWIRINGEDLKEGDVDSSGKIEVVAIQPNQTDFRVAGKTFYLKSLTDWLSL